MIVRNSFTNEVLFQVNPYPGFLGGVRVATGDVNGDGIPDLITAPGPGGGPHIRIFDGRDGSSLGLDFFAFGSLFFGGVFVAAGDVNEDNRADIIVGADAGGSPHVQVFSGADPSIVLLSVYAYGAAFGGGVRVAAGDITGDGRVDIITAPGPGGSPHIRVFDGASGQFTTDPVNISGERGSFFAYGPTFGGGVTIAAGKVNSDDQVDIITGAGPGGSPHVRVFNGATGQQLSEAIGSFFAYTPNFAGGVTVSASDVNNDGRADIITGAGPGAGPHVRAFDASSLGPLVEEFEGYSFFAFISNFTGGVFVAGNTSLTPSATMQMAAGVLAANDSGSLAETMVERRFAERMTLLDEAGLRANLIQTLAALGLQIPMDEDLNSDVEINFADLLPTDPSRHAEWEIFDFLFTHEDLLERLIA